MATWGGVAIFGACRMSHEDPPNAALENHYPGTIGMQRIDLGPVCGFTNVYGLIAAASPADLGAAIGSIRTIKRLGFVGELVDNHGVSWGDAIIESFRTLDGTEFLSGGGSCQEYEIRMLHVGG